jgi:peroxiredoxin
MRIPLKCLLTLALTVPLGVAQADEEPSTPAGHSLHGEAFNEGPRQKPYLMDGMPDIDFPITSKSAEAQKFFNQGIGQLHGFWYFEAERSFRQVAMLDTNCAMAYWGMAMANVGNEKRAKQFIEKAVVLTNGLGKREFLYVQSLAKFYLSSKEKNDDSSKPDKAERDERHRQYVKSLEQIIEEFPGDIEAKTFLVFKIWDNNGRLKISSHTAADALAQQVLEEKKLHPVHHALIHLWNNEADRRALDSASKCGQGSPGIAHMWHMPGHTYSALHRYADAAWQQEASARVDHAYMIRNRVLPDQIHNYAHNNDWLVKNLSYLGRVPDAIDLAKNLVELPRHPKYNVLTRFAVSEATTNSAYPNPFSTDDNRNRESSARFGRSRLCELMVRWELWDDLIALGQTEYLEPTEFPEEQARRAKALGIAYFSKGDEGAGASQIAAVESALKEQKGLRNAEMEEAETKARNEKKPDDQVKKAMTGALDAHASRVKSMLSSLAELKLYQSLAENDKDAVLKQLEVLKDNMAKERLAQIYLQIGDEEQAIKRAREAVEGATNQVQVLANYVDILSRCGKEEDARKQFETLRSLATHADLDLPVFKRVGPVAKALDLAEDWRARYKRAKDVGDRPSLDKLGPFRWHPSPAPEWTLRDSENRKVSLRDYHGGPVVLIFYLGYGCVHCLEQLNLFAPVADEYDRAGIKIVAIGTDSVDGLAKTFEKSKDGRGFPFRVLSDKKLDAFRAYRAYDDFEKMALHGTFLVDAAGLVRWQDVSYEPFTEPRFLLGEAKRLLKLPGSSMLTVTPRNELRSPKGNNL